MDYFYLLCNRLKETSKILAHLRGTPPALHSIVGGGSPVTLASNLRVEPADIETSRRLRLSILGATRQTKLHLNNSILNQRLFLTFHSISIIFLFICLFLLAVIQKY